MSGPKPYTTGDVSAWVDMRSDRPLLSEHEAGRMRATVEALERAEKERDNWKARLDMNEAMRLRDNAYLLKQRDALKAALAPLMSALNAETPGCRRCMDPERGPVGHEHNNLDCLQILGRTLLSQAEKLREALGEVEP